MRSVTLPAAYVIRKPNLPDKIGFEIPESQQEQIASILTDAERKGLKQLAVRIQLPHRPRTTGPRSQNARFRGHVRAVTEQLNRADGPDYTEKEVADAMKRMAVSEGYPTKLGPDGAEVPESEANLSVEDEKVLLDVVHRFADQHELYLWEYGEDGPYKSVGGRTREEMQQYLDRRWINEGEL